MTGKGFVRDVAAENEEAHSTALSSLCLLCLESALEQASEGDCRRLCRHVLSIPADSKHLHGRPTRAGAPAKDWKLLQSSGNLLGGRNIGHLTVGTRSYRRD